MHTNRKTARRATLAGAVLTGGALLALPAPAVAQAQGASAGATALRGCWEPVAAPTGAARLLCVLPADGGAAVEIATVDSGRVVSRTRAGATAERRASTKDECSGWESAQAAPDGERIYLRSEYGCPGGIKRTASGLLTLGSSGELLDIQSAGVGEGTAVRVGRYREAAASAVPAELAGAARQAQGLAASSARVAAAAPVAESEVVEVSRAVDAPVVSAWLVERQAKFKLDGKQLVALADAGVPDRVIDMMVALSYPKVFAVNPASTEGDFRPADVRGTDAVAGTSGRRIYADMFGYSPYGWNAYSPLGASLYGLGYGYGYGWYPGGSPLIVVRGQSATAPGAVGRGRAVNGRGYTRGDGSGDATPRPTASPSSGSGGSGSSAGSAGSASGGSGSGSSSGGSGRTAKPRP